ncbi:cold-shock protein [Kordiimonas marina]|uniref:cold-shock protein n=1 Tax=Kordiimonas marina TaxID=2872312 RepID=UPI001FF372F7|nr:cold shock domain-containing protein [Kordiimonas marina]
MATGKVKWFNAQKGFGFIAPDEGGNDVFVHITALKEAGIADLQEDQPVSYQLAEDRRGRQAATALKLL